MFLVSKNKPPSQKVIINVAIITALSLLGDSMLYIALPIYWEEVGLNSIWQVGILLSINRFIRLPFNPIVGWIYNRITLKTGLLIAVTIGVITTIGYGYFKGFFAWMILRALWGIGWSFFRIGGLSTVAFYADKNHRGEAMGLYNGIYRLGSLLGMLVGGGFFPIMGIQYVSVIFGFLSLLGLPIILLSLKTDSFTNIKDTDSFIETSIPFNLAFRQKFVIILSGFFITMLIQGVLTSTLSSVIEHNFGNEIEIFEMVLSVTLLSGLIQSARWVWEPFLARIFGIWSDGPIGKVPIFIFSLFFSGLIFGAISNELPLIVWIIVTLLVLMSATVITTLTDAIAIDISKTSNVVSFLTLYSIAQDMGAALGPFISYLVIELKNGFKYLYWGGAGVLATLAILWTFYYFYEKAIFNVDSKKSIS
ncbi:MFS transporter (plasmid) [Metabacillus halosaccharovorans]|uniref:MFS transporter n=1 Tax=Metabacillus halosaccharovorans TaxID=930124 RepID=UPI0025599F69|nr:MFS transporter [Metabacillus halosaccharovorans]MCM3441319.1 MFS transporter [Metabacillus halosaccharovorans]